MIYLGADHAGFELKEEIKKYLDELSLPYEDLGNKSFDPKDDYPDYAKLVSEKVVLDKKNKGLLFCSSGVGMCITANKFAGILAVNCVDEEIARLSRSHNDTNVLCLSNLLLDSEEAKKIVKTWLETEFSNEDRHLRRLNKIKDQENSNGSSHTCHNCS